MTPHTGNETAPLGRDGLAPTRVEPAAWRESCRAAAAGQTFVSLYVADDAASEGGAAGAPSTGAGGNERLVVRAVFAGEGGARVLACPVRDGRAPSIVESIPAAGWAEREAHDAFGVSFDDHRPLRPLLEHTPDLEAWTLPVHGRDTYQVAVGPIHAGVIESGHFRFHCVGERVLHVDVRLFYKHRGLERAAEGSTLAEGLAYAQRACAACAVSNSLAYAHACETTLGLVSPPPLARIRTLLLELERLYNHLNDISAVCAGVGFAAGSMAFAALKERALRVNRLLTGHRYLFGSVVVGRSDLAITAHDAAAARTEVAAIGRDALVAWEEMLFNASVQDRFVNFGRLSREDALRIGAVGPVARASGAARDARLLTRDGLHYPDFEPAMLPDPAGDVAARVQQRALELTFTLALLDELLGAAHGPSQTAGGGRGGAIGVGLVESPRGTTACVVETREGRLARLHLKTASHANWPALALAATGQIFPDFPLINKSFELCYACTDR